MRAKSFCTILFVSCLRKVCRVYRQRYDMGYTFCSSRVAWMEFKPNLSKIWWIMSICDISWYSPSTSHGVWYYNLCDAKLRKDVEMFQDQVRSLLKEMLALGQVFQTLTFETLQIFPVTLFKLGAWMIQDVPKLGIPKSKISENVILVTIAREVDHIKEFLFFLFRMVQVLVAQGDFPPQITIHL